MDGRAHVVVEPREGQLGRPASAARLVRASMTSTASPRRASINAATQPVGSRSDDDGVRAPHGLGWSTVTVPPPPPWRRRQARGSRRTGTRCVDLGVGPFGPVVEEGDPVGTRHGAEADGVLRRGMPERTLRPPPPLRGGGRRGSAGRRRPPARVPPRGTRRCPGAGSERGGAVVGDVGERGPPVAHPEAPPCARPCAELRGRSTSKPSASKRSVGETAESPVAAELARSDGEERRRHHPGQQLVDLGGPVLGRQRAA